MSLQHKFNSLARVCKKYKKAIDEHKLWYTEPFQARYLAINKLLEVHLNNRLALEALEAGEQTAPGFPSLTPARRLFYKLQEEVPPFLASGSDAYYYLQRYRIDCTHLLKTFSYSTFKGDWKKSHELISWMGAINDKQESHNAASSLEKSLEDIKSLGKLSDIKGKDLRLLEEEVRNIQALLLENPNLESTLSEKDLMFIKKAAEYLDKNKRALKGIPKVDKSFKYEEPPALGALSDRCRQLAVLVDKYKKDFDPEQLILNVDQFKRNLKSSFNLSVDVCADLYNDLMEEFGAYKVFTLKKLCDTINKPLELFSNKTYLQKRYPKGVRARHLQVRRGVPNNITMEAYFMLALGSNINTKK